MKPMRKDPTNQNTVPVLDVESRPRANMPGTAMETDTGPTHQKIHAVIHK